MGNGNESLGIDPFRELAGTLRVYGGQSDPELDSLLEPPAAPPR